MISELNKQNNNLLEENNNQNYYNYPINNPNYPNCSYYPNYPNYPNNIQQYYYIQPQIPLLNTNIINKPFNNNDFGLATNYIDPETLSSIEKDYKSLDLTQTINFPLKNESTNPFDDNYIEKESNNYDDNIKTSNKILEIITEEITKEITKGDVKNIPEEYFYIYYNLNNPILKCNKCNEIVNRKNIFGLKCKHLFCTNCYIEFIYNQIKKIKNLNEIKCLNRNCKEYFNYKFIRILYRNDDYEYEKFISKFF